VHHQITQRKITNDRKPLLWNPREDALPPARVRARLWYEKPVGAASPAEDETAGTGPQAREKTSRAIAGHIYKRRAGCRDEDFLGVRPREEFLA
jgi:hypothetical protein